MCTKGQRTHLSHPSLSLQAACTPDTVLVTVMHSNNEIGSVQPIKAIAAAVRHAHPDVLIHTDAAQSIGKVEVGFSFFVCQIDATYCFTTVLAEQLCALCSNVNVLLLSDSLCCIKWHTQVNVSDLGVHMLTIVGHKFGAPKAGPSVVAGLLTKTIAVLDKLLGAFYMSVYNLIIIIYERAGCGSSGHSAWREHHQFFSWRRPRDGKTCRHRERAVSGERFFVCQKCA